jgi:rod shape-determining protein MreD
LTTARVLLTATLLLTSVIVQTAVLSRIPFPGATPDIVLLVVIGLALQWGPLAGAVIGFGGGLLLDLVPPADGTLGRWALVVLAAGFAAGLARDQAERSVLIQVAVVGGIVASTLAAYALIGAGTGDPRVTAEAVASTLPFAVLYDVLLTPFVLPAVGALARRVDRRTVRR